jgi:hypothetical protein
VKVAIVKASRIGILVLLTALALPVFAVPATADRVSREQDIVGLRLGQRVLVDDGSCQAGEIKEVSGSTMQPTGLVVTRKCIPRLKK